MMAAKAPRRTLNRKRMRDVLLLALIALGTLPSLPWLAAAAPLFLAGCVLHLLAKGYLDRDERLIVSGPYRFVRHPFYLANFLIDLSLCAMAASPWLAAGYAAVFLAVHLPAMRAEERRLREIFGPPYDDYCRRVPALVPWKPPAPAAGQPFSVYNLMHESEIPRLLRILGHPSLVALGILLRVELLRGRSLLAPSPVSLGLLVAVVGIQLLAYAIHRRVRAWKLEHGL